MDTHTLSLHGTNTLGGLVRRWCSDCRSTHLFTTAERSGQSPDAAGQARVSATVDRPGLSTAADPRLTSRLTKSERPG